jgi:hypothetical protein
VYYILKTIWFQDKVVADEKRSILIPSRIHSLRGIGRVVVILNLQGVRLRRLLLAAFVCFLTATWYANN